MQVRFRRMTAGLSILAALGTVGAVPSVSAGVIWGAASATINSGGPGFGSIADTHNQNGLATTYVNGVTDYDTYIAGNPRHSAIFSGFEWFSNQGTTSASVTYDLGVTRTIDAFALWNEESSGIGRFDLLSSTDGTTFSSVLTGMVPTDNPINGVPDYGVDSFGFGSVSARYFRIDASGCPQADPGSFQACAIGEVAFRQGNAPLPEPGSMALAGAALAGLALSARRRKV